MKKFLFLMLFVSATACAMAPQPPKPNDQITDAVTAVQNDKCVKKDKNGKCPPLPNSPKPTPKKKQS